MTERDRWRQGSGSIIDIKAACGALVPRIFILCLHVKVTEILCQVAEPHHHWSVRGDDGANLGGRQGLPPLACLTRAEELRRSARPLVEAVLFLLPHHFGERGFLNRAPKLVRAWLKA